MTVLDKIKLAVQAVGIVEFNFAKFRLLVDVYPSGRPRLLLVAAEDITDEMTGRVSYPTGEVVAILSRDLPEVTLTENQALLYAGPINGKDDAGTIAVQNLMAAANMRLVKHVGSGHHTAALVELCDED